MSDKPIVTRFAPSPTGALHVGGARTALFSWAFARKHQGRFIIRIEDTDQKRSSPEATRGILRDLHWLGLNWDEGPNTEADDPYAADGQMGEHGPYFQSQRLDIYNEQVEKLLAGGQAYVPDGEPDIVRFRMDRDIAFEDAVFGKVEVKEADLEDFVIRKSDGFPTFHLAVVVDDALMQVTHVVRGQEHMSNTPKHAALYDALGYDRPVWVHLPSIMNPDGSKMSKRDKAKAARQAAEDHIAAKGLSQTQLVDELFSYQQEIRHLVGPPARKMGRNEFTAFMAKDNWDGEIAELIASMLKLHLPEINVADFRGSGYLPEVLLNYLALLGWSPGDDIERFDLGFLVEGFSFERVGKSNSKFDREKLFRFNGDTIKAMTPAEFEDRLGKYFADGFFLGKTAYRKQFSDPAWRRSFAAAYHERSRTLREPFELGRFFVVGDDDPSLTPDFGNKGIRKAVLKGEPNGIAVLERFLPELEAFPEEGFGAAVHDRMKAFCEEEGIGNMGKLAQPLRVAVSGGTVTPPIDVTLDLLGKASTVARVKRFLSIAPREQQAT